MVVRTPYVFLLMVWALSGSLATTTEIIVYFLFLWVLRCFSSPRSLLMYYFTCTQIYGFFLPYEFPHSDIYGLMDICSSPQLFAAYHVLHRLLVPRHSPYALCSLTSCLYIIFVLLRQSSVKKCSTYQCTFPFFYFDCLVLLDSVSQCLNAIQYCILFWFSLLIISSMFNIVSIIIFGLIAVLFFFAFAQILQYASLPYFFSLYIFQCATNTLNVIFSVCLVEIKGVEPLTSCLQGRRSSQLS